MNRPRKALCDCHRDMQETLTIAYVCMPVCQEHTDNKQNPPQGAAGDCSGIPPGATGPDPAAAVRPALAARWRCRHGQGPGERNGNGNGRCRGRRGGERAAPAPRDHSGQFGPAVGGGCGKEVREHERRAVTPCVFVSPGCHFSVQGVVVAWGKKSLYPPGRIYSQAARVFHLGSVSSF